MASEELEHHGAFHDNSEADSFSPKQKRARMDPDVNVSPNVDNPTNKHTEGPLFEDSEKDKVKPDDTEGEPFEESKINFGEQNPAVEPQLLPEVKYEYLDHTADVQIHAWGDNLAEAFEQCAMAMFAYMTDIERVDNLGSERIEASGHDMLSLLFGFLDEWLFVFNADPYFVARKISITSFDRENFKISAIGYGETFNLAKHTQGTEVKAITYSNMQFHEKDNYAEVFVIIDI